MKAYHPLSIRLAFEPSRFATEQLVKAYELLQPIKSRVTTSQKEPKDVNNRLVTVKEVKQ